MLLLLASHPLEVRAGSVEFLCDLCASCREGSDISSRSDEFRSRFCQTRRGEGDVTPHTFLTRLRGRISGQVRCLPLRVPANSVFSEPAIELTLTSTLNAIGLMLAKEC